MAVIEIAKIQVRRGQLNEVGMPQLDSGEFGWAIDAQELYIGNGSLAEGAPEIGNTQIITEHNITNLFNTGLQYIYGTSYGAKLPNGNPTTIVDVPISTGPSPVTRTLIAKLDDFVNAIDFGCVGNGATNVATTNTTALQYAIDQLYLNYDQSSAVSRKPLRLPAGNYYVDGTIYLPPYVTLVGDGPDKTIISTTSTNNIIKFCDGSSTPGNYRIIENQGITSAYPRNIELRGITFNYGGIGFARDPLISVDCAVDCVIDNCKFQGAYGSTGIPLSSSQLGPDTYAGIELRNYGIYQPTNVSIQNCVFTGLKHGIKSDYDGDSIVINNNIFTLCNRGISWSLGNNTGPTRSRIINNNFDTIYNEGVLVGQGSLYHTVANNSFVEVGNNNLGENNAITPVINFLSPSNVSVENKFTRDFYLQQNSSDTYNYVQSVAGKTLVTSNVSSSSNLVTNSPTVLARVPYAGNDQTIKLQYIATMPNIAVTRRGDLTVNVGILNQTSITDNYTYIGSNDGAITFSAQLFTATNVVKISYISSSIGTIEYQYSYLG